MATKAELAQEYLEKSMAGDVDGALALLTDDVVLDRPMLGPANGKQAVGDAMRNRPPGLGGTVPTFEAPVDAGEQVKVRGNLPPGMPVAVLNWTFSFAGDKISRIEIGM